MFKFLKKVVLFPFKLLKKILLAPFVLIRWIVDLVLWPVKWLFGGSFFCPHCHYKGSPKWVKIDKHILESGKRFGAKPEYGNKYPNCPRCGVSVMVKR